MTDKETNEIIGKIFNQISELDRKLTAVEVTVTNLSDEKNKTGIAIEEIRELISDLKTEVTKLDTPFQYETCDGFKKINHKVFGENGLDSRVKTLEFNWKAYEKRQNWKLGIIASIAGSLIVALIIAIVSYYPFESNPTDKKIDALIEVLEKDIIRRNP